MIFVITTPGHGYTVQSLIDGGFGFPIPTFRHVSYEDMLRTNQIPRATYIFADIERLTPGSFALAAHLYSVLTRNGLGCVA